MDLPEPIASGNTADIYPWHDGEIIKIFRDWMPQHSIEHEAHVARQIYETGVPVPAVGEIRQVNGKTGLIYERIDGKSLLHDIFANPSQLDTYARLQADLHIQIHTAKTTGELPDLHRRLSQRISETELPKSQKSAAIKTLQSLPKSHHICHGDLHPENILITSKGPIIIDWMDATQGHPLADVARSYIIINDYPHEDSTKDLAQRFCQTYLDHYFSKSNLTQKDLTTWQSVVAAARLAENLPFSTHKLIERVNKTWPL